MNAPLPAFEDHADDFDIRFRSIAADVRHGRAAERGGRLGVGTAEGRVIVMLVHPDGTALAVSMNGQEMSALALQLVDALEVIEPATVSVPPTPRLH